MKRIYFFCLLLVLPVICPAAHAPYLEMETPWVEFPTPIDEDLNAGYIVNDPRTKRWAIKVRVREGDPAVGWRLMIRSRNDMFEPLAFAKPSVDLEWKLNNEGINTYQKLNTVDQEVYSEWDGSNKTIRIDLKMDMGWEDPPGPYQLGVIFTVVPLA